MIKVAIRLGEVTVAENVEVTPNRPKVRNAMRPMLNMENDVLGAIVFAEDTLLQLSVCRSRTRNSSFHTLRAGNLMANVCKKKYYGDDHK